MTQAPIPPHSIDAEQSVLGALLLSPRVLFGIAIEDGLRPEHFYRPQHAHIYRAILDLNAASEPIDALTLTDRLERSGQLEPAGGRPTIYDLASYAPASGNGRHHGRIVQNLAHKRAVLCALYDSLEDAASPEHEGAELIARLEQRILELSQSVRPNAARSLAAAVGDELARLQRISDSENPYAGLATGLSGLDELLGGLHPGNLTVLAARPAMGKSAFAQSIAHHVAHHDGRVLFASLEMSESEVTQRYLSGASGVTLDLMRKGQLTDRHWPPLLRAAARADDARLSILDAGDLTLGALTSYARRAAHELGGLDLLVVDYLQLLRAEPPSGNRVEDVSAFSRGLKRLARQLDCPVLALSQLSRAVEARTDKRPLLSDLRESGSIEADADVVLMLYRDDYYDPDSERPGELDVLIRKNRNGPLGELTLTFQSARLRFLPLAA